jgi:hypothetical protein
LKAASDGRLDFAVLDVNVDGEFVFPVAEVLRRRRVPFIFSTGYGPIGVPERYQSYEVLSKPFAIEELQKKILRALGN